MSKNMTDTTIDLRLPTSVVSKVDLSRLLSELEYVDNELTAAAVRAGIGANNASEQKISEQLSDFLNENDITLDDSHSRTALIKQVRALKKNAPVIHMTFATSADSESLRELCAWLRDSIHPQMVVSVGMQPSLLAGVYLRTANHVKDLSLRARLRGTRSLMVNELEALRGSK